MNRMELEQQIIEEGKKRGMTIVECGIYDHETHLVFYPKIRNDTADDWIYEHELTELINDLAPLERHHKVERIVIDREFDFFKIGDTVEIDNLWIRLDTGEKEPDTIKVSRGCGTWRSGWVKGKVFETPAENDRMLGVTFDRDVYIEKEDTYFSNVDELERLVKNGEIKKVGKGQAVWVGHCSWTVRKA